MKTFAPYTAEPYPPKHRTAMILQAIHRKQINQLAHAHALRVELEIRDKWVAEMTQALEGGLSFVEIQERIAKLAS